jgi:hypothetical protein
MTFKVSDDRDKSEPALRAWFDQPSFDDVTEGYVQFSGWCFHAEHPVTGLHLTVDSTTYAVRYGLNRPDVAMKPASQIGIRVVVPQPSAMRGRGAGNGARQVTDRRDGPETEQAMQLLVQHPGAFQLVPGAAIVRVFHSRLGRVGERLTGEQHLPPPGKILGNGHLGEGMRFPRRPPERRADVVECAAVQALQRHQLFVFAAIAQPNHARLSLRGHHPASCRRVRGDASAHGTWRANTPAMDASA